MTCGWLTSEPFSNVARICATLDASPRKAKHCVIFTQLFFGMASAIRTRMVSACTQSAVSPGKQGAFSNLVVQHNMQFSMIY